MHVHLPKPLHGWREFVGEVGIIVIGVLIALSAEQVVESWHWHEVTHDTKAALQDSSEDIYAAMLSRVDMQDCVNRRLAEISTIMQRHEAGQPLGIVGPIGTPTAIQADLSVFDMAIANQAFSHMTMADQQRYFSIEGSYRTFQKAADLERDVWQSLQSLNQAKALTPSDWSDVRKAYNRALDVNDILTNDLRGSGDGDWLAPLHGYAKPQGYSLRSIPRVKKLCMAMTA